MFLKNAGYLYLLNIYTFYLSIITQQRFKNVSSSLNRVKMAVRSATLQVKICQHNAFMFFKIHQKKTISANCTENFRYCGNRLLSVQDKSYLTAIGKKFSGGRTHLSAVFHFIIWTPTVNLIFSLHSGGKIYLNVYFAYRMPGVRYLFKTYQGI